MTGIPNDSDSDDGIARASTCRTLLGAVGSLALTGASAGCLPAGDDDSDATEFTAGTFAHFDGHCMDCVSPSPS